MYEIRLNTARNALRILIRAYNIKELFIPYYICPVIREAIIKENAKIKFYHIDNNFFPDTEAIKSFKKDSFILYPNYFGICAKNVYSLSNDYKNLIIDNAHAFFMNQNLGLASFVSLRKIFHTPDGSILYTKEKIDDNIIQLLTRDEDRKTPTNENEFLLNESLLNKLDIKLMSQKTSNFFNTLNLNHEKEKKLLKFNTLQNRFSSHNDLKISLTNNDIPYIYPYLTDSKKIKNKITNEILKNFEVLRFWNSLPRNFLEYKFYKYLMVIKYD